MIIKGLLHADRKRKVERKEMTRAFWTAADKIWRMSKTSRFRERQTRSSRSIRG
jgi:hypothetical protein